VSWQIADKAAAGCSTGQVGPGAANVLAMIVGGDDADAAIRTGIGHA
jgi:hypothetical protein